MALSKNKTIARQTAQDYQGVENDYNTRVWNRIYQISKTAYHENNIPHFTGTVKTGIDVESNASVISDFTNSVAIEPNQFGSKPDGAAKMNIPLTIPDNPTEYPDEPTTITAKIAWSEMKTLVTNFNRLRPFTAIWYHRRNVVKGPKDKSKPKGAPFPISAESPGKRYEVDRISGIGVFKKTLPDVNDETKTVPGTNIKYVQVQTSGVYKDWYSYHDVNQKWNHGDIPHQSRYWSRTIENPLGQIDSTTKNPVLDLDQTIFKNDDAIALNMDTYIQKCYDEWYDKCYTHNQLVYKMYTCHLDCHCNCHSQRSRR